jgi:hypothetical protein
MLTTNSNYHGLYLLEKNEDLCHSGEAEDNKKSSSSILANATIKKHGVKADRAVSRLLLNSKLSSLAESHHPLIV